MSSQRFSTRSLIPLALLGVLGCPTDDTVVESDHSTSESGDERGTESDSETGDDPTDTDSETGDDPTDTDSGGPLCGDGVVEGDEQCDDGNTDDGDACSNQCTAGLCGDGIVQAGEGCDAGADNGPGQACNASCQPNVCGDADMGPGEGCDDGNDVDDDQCTNDCTLPSCGNGAIDVGEQCDDGNDVNEDDCLDTCVAAACGDGFVHPDAEACDEAALNSDTSQCTSACQLAACGDGLVWLEMEVCDDGNLANDDGCSSTCALEDCGDGIVQVGEDCDDGNASNDDACTNACSSASCGDGFQQPGEECDDGNDIANDGCSNACTVSICGDDILQDGEACDDGLANGNDAACTPECTLAACGDGYLYDLGGEQCDDGNVLSNDGCSATCSIQKVVQVSAGDLHTCVLTNANTVRCWGYGGHGRLGYGSNNSISDDELPSAAGDVNVGGPVVQISAGGTHTCALLVGGAVRCWGNNEFGQLGYGNTAAVGDNETPGSVATVPVGGSVVNISVGWQHTCAVLDSATVRCWGRGHHGVLGYGNLNNIGDNETPAAVGDVDVGGPVAKVSAGRRHTCALMVSGAVRCWGIGDPSARLGYPTIGYETIGDDESPASVGDVNIGGIAVDVSAGGAHTCVRFDNGEVGCWGAGAGGALGYGSSQTIGDDEHPAEAGFVSVGASTTQITTGSQHTCAVLVGGDVRCWGYHSQLGYPNSVEDIGDDELPSETGPVSLAGPAVQVSSTDDHTCAVLGTGAVLCWGENALASGYGFVQVGDDEHPSEIGPVQVF